MDRNLYVLGFHPWKLYPYNQVPVLLEHVYRRGPFRGVRPLPPARPAAELAEHLIEQAVHFAVGVVETAASKRTHRHSSSYLLPLLAPWTSTTLGLSPLPMMFPAALCFIHI